MTSHITFSLLLFNVVELWCAYMLAHRVVSYVVVDPAHLPMCSKGMHLVSFGLPGLSSIVAITTKARLAGGHLIGRTGRS